jgi:hypothetical protein
VLLATPGIAEATEDVSVPDLVNNSEELSGAEVAVVGELVGDYGFRDDGRMWSQLNGDAYVSSPIRDGGQPVGGNTGVGIRMPTQLGDGLDQPGGYRNRGPIVRVTGIWKHHDPARQGESYLDVVSLTIVEPGRAVSEEPLWIAIWAGLGLLAGAFVFWQVPSPSGAAKPHDRPEASP